MNSRKNRGIVSITIIILCVSVLMLSSYGLYYANSYYDSHTMYLLNKNCESIAMQAMSYLDYWFLDNVKAGKIPSPVSPKYTPDGDDYSPVYTVTPDAYSKLSEVNKHYKIEMYIVNANYGGNLPDQFTKLSLIKKESAIVNYINQSGDESKYGLNGYYAIIFIKPDYKPGYLYVYKKEFYGLKDKSGKVTYYNNIISFLSLADKDK